MRASGTVRDQRLTNGTLLGGPQPNVRGTTATPAALDGREGRGLGPHEQLLLLRGELHHGPAALGVAQRRENAARHAKVGVAHVIGFQGLRQTQGDASELAGCHEIAFLGLSAMYAAPSARPD